MSEDACSVCGLPQDLCTCSNLAREKQVVNISTGRRRYGKIMTMINGIDPTEVDIKSLAKKLKTSLACGGTVKKNTIELQGDQRKRAKDVLIKQGFAEESIRIK